MGSSFLGGLGLPPGVIVMAMGSAGGRDLRCWQRLPDDRWPAGANGLPAAHQLLPLPLLLLTLIVSSDSRGRGPIFIVVFFIGGGGQEEEEAVRRVWAVQAAHQLRRLLVLPQQEDGSSNLQVQEV